jgi:hypothetical protein
VVVVMDFLGCGKPLSTFKFLFYFVYICCVIEKVTSQMWFLLGFSLWVSFDLLLCDI